MATQGQTSGQPPRELILRRGTRTDRQGPISLTLLPRSHPSPQNGCPTRRRAMRSTGLRALLISISATVAIVACAGGQTAPTPTAVASQAPPTAAPTPPVTPTAAPQATATPAPEATPSPTPVPATPDVPFTLMSDVFVDGGPIPVEYTCEGPDVQLPLSWTGTPAGTVELALVMDDPD